MKKKNTNLPSQLTLLSPLLMLLFPLDFQFQYSAVLGVPRALGVSENTLSKLEDLCQKGADQGLQKSLPLQDHNNKHHPPTKI